MASNTGARPAKPEQSRDRARLTLSRSAEKSLRRVLYDAGRRGLIASELSFARLKSWLTREAKGSTVDYRSPFWSKRKGSSRVWAPREELVKDFMRRIETQEVGLPGPFLEILLDVERAQAGNISAQSPYLPWDEDGPEKVAEVYKDKPGPSKLNTRALGRAFDRAVALIPANSIRMDSIDDVVRRTRVNPHSVDEPGMDTHTNSSSPYYVNPWKPNGNLTGEKLAESAAAFDFIVRRAKAMQVELLSGNPVSWNAIVAKRLAQKSKPEKRKRIVIALEKAEPVIWKTFTPQVYDALRQVKSPGGVRYFVAQNDLPEHDKDCQLALDVAHNGGRIVIGGDYAGYDSTLAPWLIRMAGQIVGKWVYKGEKLVTALAESMSSHVTLITPNKIWDETPGSMKSGSGGTNLLDSVANLLVMFYGEEIGAWKLVNASVQGDDFILDGVGATPEGVYEVASQFNLEAHPDKQMYKEDALAFLQKIHLRGYIGGIASVARTLGSVMSYERLAYRPDEWGPWVDVIRALSQLENTAFSPWFETLVEFVRDGDQLQLGANRSPSDILIQSGNAGLDWIQRESGKPNKLRNAQDDGTNGFVQLAVNGVLRGEKLPPLGSDARFSRVYRTRA